MTDKQKQDRKKVIEERAAALKKAQEEYADAVRAAEALEATGKWDEAAIAWGIVADYAGAAKQKKSAAGKQAAAKVRASAATKSLEGQLDKQAATEAPPLPMTDRDREDATAEGEASGATDSAGAAATDAENRAEAEGEGAPEPEGTAPKGRDPRLPAPGTVLTKTDRTGAERVRCTVIETGVEYAGETYKTLSAAGLKAMADLGLKASTCDGFAFWGLKKSERAAAPPKEIDFEALDKLVRRCREMAARGMETADADQRTKVKASVAWLIEALQQAITPAASTEEVPQ
ncbi:MAG: DUF2924 domain-containing protein [Chloroflexota bacterium]|nr:DUF2924 domain-containing protein [Chloroflexota bacterium]